jgi:hypothetical protein
MVGGVFWMVLGVAILVGSLRMDRLESQGVSPYAAPGLMPGLLGISVVLLGGLLARRGWRQGGGRAAVRTEGEGMGRLALVLGLCLLFDIGLVGHGLPFWAGSSLFVTASILALQHANRRAAGQRLTGRPVAIAALIGVAAGLAVTLVFQGIFLVHLP